MKKGRLLLLEDDEANRLTLTALLEDAGYEVTEASSLSEARAHLRAATFVWALLDLHLPDGLGTDLIAELSVRSPGTTVAVLTGEPDLVSGAQVVFSKGEDPIELLSRLERTQRSP